jgi:hypothetical protein
VSAVSRRLLLVAGAAAAALVGAVVAFAALVAWDEDDAAPSEKIAEITADATLSPEVVFFGDTVRIRFDVVVDKTRVDPESVRIAADFEPFAVVGQPERSRRDAGDRAFVSTTFMLRCVSGTCLPSGDGETYEFPPARVRFAAAAGEEADQSSITQPVPSILLFSRFAALQAQADPREQPWKVDQLSLPAVSYRVAPGLLVALLLACGVLAALGGAVLAYLAWPKRAPAPPPEPEPPPPEPALSPLEQALALLEQSIRLDGSADQRRALELVAEELELEEWGDPELARAARALAWSEDVPPVDETTRLAAQVRTSIPEEETGAGEEEAEAHAV